MNSKVLGLVELLSYGMSFTLAAIMAAAMVYTKIYGVSSITFTFNAYHEHLLEAIVFPVSVISSFVFLLKRAYNFRNQSDKVELRGKEVR